MSQLKRIFIFLLISYLSSTVFAQLSERELITAINLDDLSKIESHFKNGQSDPNVLIGKYKVPLIHYVCSKNKYETLKILIDWKADLNILFHNETPLMTAIYYDNHKITELLLKKGADPNLITPDTKTASIHAAIYGKMDALEILNKYNANFKYRDKNKKAALDYAWDMQNVKCYKYLSKLGENKYSNLKTPDYFDGPYVFWEGKNKLKVSYLISDSKTLKTYEKDSLLEYKKDKVILNGSHQTLKIPIRKVKKRFSPKFEFSNVKKIMAIGDIHGEYQTLKRFLINNKIVDKDLNWTFDDGHLLLIGDIFDRGPEVNECLWLLYKLESEALINGGHVHFILGNHEIMQLSGDKRYLSPKYKYLFNKLGINYTDVYAENTELGRWMRTKNTIVRINDILFVHGGLSYKLVENKIELNLINIIVRDIISRKNKEPKNDIEELILGNSGPLWYRGYIKLSDSYYKNTGEKYDITQELVDEITDYFSVKTIVFANTHVKEITPMFNNKLYGIDIPFASEKNIQLQGLYIEKNNYYKAFINGTKKKMN